MTIETEAELLTIKFAVFAIGTVINGLITTLLMKMSKKAGGIFCGIFELLILLTTLSI
jgi:hypothetical protein